VLEITRISWLSTSISKFIVSVVSNIYYELHCDIYMNQFLLSCNYLLSIPLLSCPSTSHLFAPLHVLCNCNHTHPRHLSSFLFGGGERHTARTEQSEPFISCLNSRISGCAGLSCWREAGCCYILYHFTIQRVCREIERGGR